MKTAALALLPLGLLAIPGDDTEPTDETQAAVEQAFADYLATLDPIGEAFHAQTCSNLDDFWFCFAIDEGVIYASVQLPVIGDGPPSVTDATRFDPGTGTPLPGTTMNPTG